MVRANGNLQDANSTNPQKYIAIDVTNNGDKPTTLVLITFRYYKTKPNRWRKNKSEQRGLFNPLRPTANLPYRLDVGAKWSCLVYQTKELEEMSKDGYFYIEAEDTSTSKSTKFSRSRLLLE